MVSKWSMEASSPSSKALVSLAAASCCLPRELSSRGRILFGSFNRHRGHKRALAVAHGAASAWTPGKGGKYELQTPTSHPSFSQVPRGIVEHRGNQESPVACVTVQLPPVSLLWPARSSGCCVGVLAVTWQGNYKGQ